MATGSTTAGYAHTIYDNLTDARLGAVSYTDYEPAEVPGMFESDIARRFGFIGTDNALIREAVMWLEEQNMIEIDRTYDEDRPTEGSQGQPYPARVTCEVVLR